MKLFEFRNHSLHISEMAYALDPFRKIWTRDKTRNKQVAQSELSYIYFMHDFRSDFVEQYGTEAERNAAVLETLGALKPTWKPDKVVKEAIDFYLKHSENIKMKMVKDVIQSLHKLRKYFQTIDFTLLDDNGKPVYNITKYSNVIKDLEKNMSTLDKMKALALKDAKEAEARGSIEKNVFEDGF